MAHFERHTPGTFCWIELATTDAPAAKTFYTSLFGWTTRENDLGGELGIYYIFQCDGRDCAAMYQMGAQQQGMPPNWMSYVCVQNADDTARKAKSLGGNVIVEPFDVYDFGRMAVLFDSQGAALALWQPKTHIGVQIRDQANTLCWSELQARDFEKAKQFYAALFGWTVKASPEYSEFHIGERAVGGMLQSQAPEGVPSFWLPYFAVDDCDAAVEQASRSGATVHVPPMDIENVGRFAVLMDPQGASFAVIRLELMSHA